MTGVKAVHETFVDVIADLSVAFKAGLADALSRFSKCDTFCIDAASSSSTGTTSRSRVTTFTILLVASLTGTLSRAHRIDTLHVVAGTEGRVATFIHISTVFSASKVAFQALAHVPTDRISTLSTFVTLVGFFDSIKTE